MTYNKIKLKEPCIYLPKENTEISLEKLFKHKEVFVDLSREGLRIISPLFSGHTIILRGLSHFLKNFQGKAFCKKAW